MKAEDLIEFVEKEREFWRANQRGDGDFFEKHTHDDALIVGGMGVFTKEDGVAVIRENTNPFESFELFDFRGSGTGSTYVLTYRADVMVIIEGQRVPFSVQATSVYAFDEGEWKSLLHQQSVVGD